MPPAVPVTGSVVVPSTRTRRMTVVRKIELLYGLSNNFQIGFSRESLKKTYALNAKYNITNQSSKLPLNSSLYLSYNYNSSLNEDIYPNLSNSDKDLFFGQLL